MIISVVAHVGPRAEVLLSPGLWAQGERDGGRGRFNIAHNIMSVCVCNVLRMALDGAKVSAVYVIQYIQQRAPESFQLRLKMDFLFWAE